MFRSDTRELRVNWDAYGVIAPAVRRNIVSLGKRLPPMNSSSTAHTQIACAPSLW
jgi:hypothetical protein